MTYTDKKRKSWSYSLTLTVAIVGATLAGGMYGNRLLGSPVQDELQQRFREYTDLLSAAEQWSAADLGPDKLVFSSVEGMLRTLDPHTSFFEPTEYLEMQDRQKGTFYGLGILVTKRNEQVTVITPLEGTPASRLGIRAGDIISEVEGISTNELSLDEVVKRLKGPKGSTVHIKIVRTGMKEPIPLTIVRAAIPTNSISNVLMVRPGVGYIRIKDFTYTTVRELDDAIARLQKEGMTKLLLDLRQNPGGLLDAAVGVSDHFIDKGQMIVYTKGRAADSSQEYTAPGKHQRLTLPLVILINRGSASASEIVAGTIQDHDRGLIVGETSWGKGLVQSVYTLQYGAGLALTTSKYYTPSGRNIQRDYTSFYDYYVADVADDATRQPEPPKGAKVYTTDIGRKVFGGGGITPDVVVKPRELSRTVQLLEVRSAIFNFAVDYFAKHPGVSKDFTVSAPIMEEFVQYASSKEVASVSEIRKALGSQLDRDYLERALRAEIVAAKFGYDASYPIRLQGDDQVARALELFPAAEKLASQSIDIHSARTAKGPDKAVEKTSANDPKSQK
ncbi:MAG TPA: S41 family peptidase [Thermoanaerobaculia bacterium]|nr:S41 family peptidase [Thermoanaerobaculia bacterium]